MISILVRRILSLVVTLFVVSLLIFTVMGLLPGDPAAIMLGTSASPETLAALQKQDRRADRDAGRRRQAP